MKNTPNLNFRSIISASQSVAIVLLFSTLIFMFAQYCILNNASAPSSLPKLSEKDGGVFFAPSDTEVSGALITPVIAGFCNGERTVSPSVHNGDYEKFVRLSIPFVKAVFSDISTLLDFSSESARAEYISDLTRGKSFLYFHFGNDLPAAAFYPSYAGDAQEDIFHSFNLRELYILLDGGSISGVARDSLGNIATLSVQDKVSLSFDSFSALLSSSFSNSLKFESVSGISLPVFESSVTTSKLFEYNTTGDFTQDNAEGVENALSAFGFNPNGTRFYKSSTDGSLTYVQEQGELSVTVQGDIEYTSSGNGMPLSEFLDRQRNIYSFSEKICSAYNIVNSLDKALYGKDASLCLSSVSYKEELLTLEFSYMVSGIPFSLEPAAVFTFSDTSLVSASVTRKSISRLANTGSDIPQKLLLAIYAPQIEDKAYLAQGAFIPVYTKETGVEGGNIFSAKYAFVTASDNHARKGGR